MMVFFFVCAAVVGLLLCVGGAAVMLISLLSNDPDVGTAKAFVCGVWLVVTGFGVAGCSGELAKRMEWEREAAEVAAKEVK